MSISLAHPTALPTASHQSHRLLAPLRPALMVGLREPQPFTTIAAGGRYHSERSRGGKRTVRPEPMLTNKPSAEALWSMFQDGNVVGGVIPEGLSGKSEAVHPLRKRDEKFVRCEAVTAPVTVFKSEDRMGWDVLDVAQKGAERGVEHGLERWAIVADGIKQDVMRKRIAVSERPVYTTEDRSEALTWARGDRPDLLAV